MYENDEGVRMLRQNVLFITVESTATDGFIFFANIHTANLKRGCLTFVVMNELELKSWKVIQFKNLYF